MRLAKSSPLVDKRLGSITAVSGSNGRLLPSRPASPSPLSQVLNAKLSNSLLPKVLSGGATGLLTPGSASGTGALTPGGGNGAAGAMTPNTTAYTKALRQRHAAILGICALVDSYPYTIEKWMPELLTGVLVEHTFDPVRFPFLPSHLLGLF